MLRTDIWAAAFVRRHNDIGHICVVMRRGDPVAGQVFVVVDHLDGTQSLYTPAPALARGEDNAEARMFELRLERVHQAEVNDRVAREQRFDPDLWLLSLELRRGDPGLEVVE